jgi:uncharacterized protein (TIGR03067 family)
MPRHIPGLVLLTVALTAPTWADDKGSQGEKIYGTWIASAVESKGKTMPPPDGMSVQFNKDGDLFWCLVKRTDAPDEIGTFKENTTKRPKELDLIGPKLVGKERVTKAIYQLDGDTLKIAIPGDRSKGDRPTSFDSEKAMIFIMKRQTP